MSRSYSEPTWMPRRDLALPNELLHKIIPWVIRDSVHRLCVSTEDTTWEKNVMVTLHQVSPSFRAISSEIAVKAFDIARDARKDDEALLRTLREIFTYLSLLGVRSKHPSECSIAIQTIDCSASSYVFAHALFLTCTSLRKHAIHSTPDEYGTTHNIIISGLDRAEALCDRVRPSEMTALLRPSMRRERELAVLGLKAVQGFNSLVYNVEGLPHFQGPGEGGVAAAFRSLISGDLDKLDGIYEAYERILNDKSSSAEPHVYDLPGVLPCLRKVAALTIKEDQFSLRERTKKLVDQWSTACPFLSSSASCPTLHDESPISGVISSLLV